PFFCVDLLHHLDGQVALGEQLLQSRVLLLQRAQLLHVGCFQFAVPLAPHVQRLLADPVLLGDLRDRRLIRLAQDLDHLVLGESCLPHTLLALLAGAIFSTFNWSENRPAGQAGIRYFLWDAMGSTIALTDSSQTVQQTYSYDPYGVVNATGASSNPYQYTG